MAPDPELVIAFGVLVAALLSSESQWTFFWGFASANTTGSTQG